MNIINAIEDPNLFRNFLSENDDDLESWKNWKVALRALYGLAIRSKRSYAIVEECTGRNPGLLPEDGFRTALFLTGRRSGKSRTAAVIGAFEAALAGHDLSGGRSDDAALAIGHRNGRTVIIDLLHRYKAPFNPHRIVSEMANELKRYSLKQVTGDNYAADFVAQAFEGCGIGYMKAEKPKSTLYAELLPRLCSKEIELLDDPLLINQLASLERRTRSGGRDIIDHPAGQHDDLANAVAGVAEVAAVPVLTMGAF